MHHDNLIFDAATLSLEHLPKIDAHLHTAWTDGKGTVREVYDMAVSAGLSTILFSEHSRKTSVDWFPDFAAEVRSLPDAPCRAYVGTECKVEAFDGSIDTVPAIADSCDYIVASVHRFPDGKGGGIPFDEVAANEAVDFEYELSWAVLANPAVDILGHIFGMSFRRFKAMPDDKMIRPLIGRAAKYGVAIEINSHYHDNPWQLFEWCQELGARVTFGSNAHTLDTVGKIVALMSGGRKL